MSKTRVSTEASQQTGSEIYIQTYRKLLRQRELIDRDIMKLQRKFMRVLSGKKILSDRIVKYVPRLDNTTTLAAAIRVCMVPKEKMTMTDILKSLSKRKLYKTDSKYFYTMVNNKLNRDPHIKKISRGIFVYSPCGRRKAAA